MEFVYHYTSIGVLALILKNKTIRLNCLKKVDDMDEGITKDFGNLSKYLFASCWTNDPKENIALWNMYTPNMAGIRIGLSSDMLELKYDKDNFIMNGKFYGRDEEKGISLFAPFGPLPKAVEYNDEDQKKRFVTQISEEKSSVNLSCLGLLKNMQWKFQKESRLLFVAFPKNHPFYGMTDHEFGEMLLGMMAHKALKLSYLDLPLKDEAFNQMEIMLGPRCNESDRIIVDSLVSSYLQSKGIKVKQSSLRIRRC